MSATLGFLGLGSMGAGMASRLLETGHDVLVWNRSKDAVAELVAKGAREAATPAEALAAEVSFSMLSNDAAVEAVLTAFSDPGDLIYEPFCGSGTQIVAAERAGRRCFAMELDPAYCDVAVRRWEMATGRTVQRSSADAANV